MPLDDDKQALGHVRLWRQSIGSPVFQDPVLWKVWTWCIMRANWKANTVPVTVGRGTQLVPLRAGQFIFGRHAASEQLSLPPSTVRNKVEKLVGLGCLDSKPDSHFSIITICNWTTYQSDGSNGGQPSGQAKDRQRTGKGQAKDTEKKEQKGLKEKKTTTSVGYVLEGFNEFWSTYPGPRKQHKSQCYKKWVADKLEFVAAMVLDWLQFDIDSDQWRREEGRYIPAPLVWLRKERWVDGPPPEDEQRNDERFKGLY